MKGDEISVALEAAARLLSRPNAWGRGAFARRKRGDEGTHEADPAARCFCVAGAINRQYGGRFASPEEAFRRVASVLGLPTIAAFGHVVDWNDSKASSQRKAVAALRKAARL